MTQDLDVSWPSTGNLTTMDLIARTMETTTLVEPLSLRLSNQHAEHLLTGDGPKAKEYEKFADKTLFFSDDEDRHRTHKRQLSLLDEAVWCHNDFMEGDVYRLVGQYAGYLDWLLGGEQIPARFLRDPSYSHGDNGEGSSITEKSLNITVTWFTKSPIRYAPDTFMETAVLCWESAKERIKVYIDAQLNVTYSFTFEEVNISAHELPGRVPRALAEALSFMTMSHPSPTQSPLTAS